MFGEGSPKARILAVGEQPGDYEDKEGRPFVGPAGKLLSKGFADAGIDPAAVYITNAVKHFKFEERGKRRIHKKPDHDEMEACRPWLQAEIAMIRPRLILALGVTAAETVLLKKVRIKDLRGRVVDHPSAAALFVTVHPSSILRSQPDTRADDYAAFVQDLKAAARWLTTV